MCENKCINNYKVICWIMIMQMSMKSIAHYSYVQHLSHCTIFEMDSSKLFTVLQITDSSFPTGGFAHSLGLEAYIQYFGNLELRKDVRKMFSAIMTIMENSGSLNLPFVKSAYLAVSSGDHPLKKTAKCQFNSISAEMFQHANGYKNGSVTHTACQSSLDMKETLAKLKHLDIVFEAFATSHIVYRASVRQGKALLDVCLLLYCDLYKDLLAILSVLPHCHYSVIYGAILAGLGLDLETTLASFMFTTVRAMITALVKLDMLGALEGQKLQQKLQELIPGIVERNYTKTIDDAGLKFPVVDIVQNLQDTFFTKMFYS
ncbi:hypothetical protein Btru_033115 [Bulinus truncatus]|nr:hypothetical protein Btru_033115 [Bulinus truncatus]